MYEVHVKVHLWQSTGSYSDDGLQQWTIVTGNNFESFKRQIEPEMSKYTDFWSHFKEAMAKPMPVHVSWTSGYNYVDDINDSIRVYLSDSYKFAMFRISMDIRCVTETE